FRIHGPGARTPAPAAPPPRALLRHLGVGGGPANARDGAAVRPGGRGRARGRGRGVLLPAARRVRGVGAPRAGGGGGGGGPLGGPARGRGGGGLRAAGAVARRDPGSPAGGESRLLSDGRVAGA